MKNETLHRIKAAIESGEISSAERREVKPEEARLVAKDLGQEELVALFEERARSSGMKVHHVTETDSLESILASLLPEGSLVAAAMGNPDVLPLSCRIVEGEKIDRDDLFQLDAAVTEVKAAVAETGSIVLHAGRDRARTVSLTAEIHIALVRKDRIVADLLDWTESLENELPHGFTLITGPSKTADIELNLVIGVHGPAEVHAVFLDG